MTLQEILELPSQTQAMFAIDLLIELFDLHDFFQGTNFSGFMRGLDTETLSEFEAQCCVERYLTEQQKRDRLLALFSSLTQ